MAGRGAPWSQVFRWDLSSRTWSRPPEIPKFPSAATTMNGSNYYTACMWMSPTNSIYCITPCSAMDVLNLSSSQWSEGPSLLPCRNMSCVGVDNYLFCFTDSMNDVPQRLRICPETGTWEPMISCPYVKIPRPQQTMIAPLIVLVSDASSILVVKSPHSWLDMICGHWALYDTVQSAWTRTREGMLPPHAVRICSMFYEAARLFALGIDHNDDWWTWVRHTWDNGPWERLMWHDLQPTRAFPMCPQV
jgi:hypothetical protein